ncbi:MAG TPA: aldehyde dehydrogenase (NADP(+)) [Candidatus Acidoferrales bacterium]|jgi:NADP-dependent aldehyde dehydrogenase|nr:aldehyde dehydrogenase (NADP(+)) [Candidatus Acidoferrales bacterium]
MDLKGKSFIGWASGADGGKKFTAVNPATNSALEPAYTSASTEEADRAAQLAAQAFTSYSKLSGKEKAVFLRAIAKGLEGIADLLVVRVNQEAGLPDARIRSETARTVFQLRLFADLVEEGSWVRARLDRPDPARKPAPKPDLRSMWVALGPVVVFGASNFPLAYSVAGGDTASAFAAGNPVIVKAHPAHPGTSELVGDVIRSAARECKLPEGIFSLVFDAGTEVGAALVRHPFVRAVGFTGSQRGGRALMDIAAARPEPIPVFAEMGSTNPVFLLPGALAARGEQIAEGMHGSVTLGAGQFCTKPGLVFLPPGAEANSFSQSLARRMAESPAPVMLTPQIQAAYAGQVAARAGQSSVAVAAEGKAAGSEPGVRGRAALFTTGAREFIARPDLAAEVFGPAALVVSCSRKEEMLEIARGLHGHLTATVHGTEEDLRENQELIEILKQKAGRLVFNGFPTGVEVGHAIIHGGPYPATSDGQSTSVGSQAIYRFARPVCYQNFPSEALPGELKDANPLGIRRLVGGAPEKN